MVGFVFWYRGLALGGIASVGQLQLLQPFFGLALAALVIGEPVSGTMLAVSAVVVPVRRRSEALRLNDSYFAGGEVASTAVKVSWMR